MAHLKLILEDDYKEVFSLLAIHCSEADYKMAYLLNQYAGLRLRRKKVDLDFSENGLQVTFPIFEFENQPQYTTYHLVANKCKSFPAHVNSSQGLFAEDNSETLTTYLIKEYKNVDYFLKIYSDFESIPLRKLISNINEIKEVISAYSIEPEQIKLKNNLIVTIHPFFNYRHL